MCHTQRSLRAVEDIIEALRSHILYLNSTPRARGKVVRLLRSPLVSRGRTRTASVFCFSILPMVMSRYEICPLQCTPGPRECYRGENKGRNRNE